jgi:hypothetical protein
MRLLLCLTTASAAALLAAACTGDPSAPNSSIVIPGRLPSANLSPNRNLEVILRPAEGADGFGLVKFRQPKDDATIVYLDTWIRDLEPNTSYRLERAVDSNIDDVCTSTMWLLLGTITTDERGTGREALFRNLASPPGTAFDIHFRVVKASTGAVVLQSACYQFEVSL